MAIYQAAMRTYMAAQYAAKLAWVGALTALGTGGAVGTEVTGGSPAYARAAASWGAASASAVSGGGSTLNIPSGTTVVGVGMYDVNAGAPTCYDQATVTSQTFASQGTYTITPTFTQT